jgi:hypothetical protein
MVMVGSSILYVFLYTDEYRWNSICYTHTVSCLCVFLFSADIYTLYSLKLGGERKAKNTVPLIYGYVRKLTWREGVQSPARLQSYSSSVLLYSFLTKIFFFLS